MAMDLDYLVRINESRLRGLHPTVVAATRKLIEQAYKRNVYVRITQGLRTLQEQARLYAQGRTAPGPKVTDAPPGHSWHNFGLAVDFALYTLDGKKLLWDTRIDQDRDGKADWLEVVEEAKKQNFRWGGDWTSFKDYPHFEMKMGFLLSQLRSKPSLAYWTSGQPSQGAAEKGGNKNVLQRNGNNDTEAVKALQKDLLELGYKLPKFGADGSYGEELEIAVKQFQKDHNLVADGIAGPATFEAIAKEKVLLEKLKKNTPASVHQEAIEWVKKMGISDGSDPWEPASRQQVNQMLFNFYTNLLNPQDAAPSPRFKEAIEWAKNSAISDGSKPKVPANREQVIQMLYADNKRKDTL